MRRPLAAGRVTVRILRFFCIITNSPIGIWRIPLFNMKYIHLTIINQVITTFLFIFIASCNSSTDSWYEDSEFSVKEERIKKIDYVGIDIIPEISLKTLPNYDHEPAITLNIFNYGGDIQINKGCKTNIFSDLLYREAYFNVISKDNVIITKECHDKKYGKYGFATILNNGVRCNNVFLSPLAYSHIKYNSNSNNKLILAMLSLNSNEVVLMALFLADDTTAYYIENHNELIQTFPDFYYNKPNQMLWKPLDNFYHD